MIINKMPRFILGITLLVSSCNQDFGKSYSESGGDLSLSNGLLNISFEVLSSTDYEGDFDRLDYQVLSSMNPHEEMQRVNFVLNESGESDLVIENVDFSEGIKIPHQDLPDDRPSVKKILISGGFISTYDNSGNLLGKESIDRLDFTSLLSDIKEIKNNNSKEDIYKAVNKFQSVFFKNRLIDFIETVKKNKSPILKTSQTYQIVEENDATVTFSVDLSQIEQGQQGRSLIVVNKIKNRLIADRTFDDFNQMVQTTYYGYSSGELEVLDAIRTEQPIKIGSDNEISKITCTKISNFSLNLN